MLMSKYLRLTRSVNDKGFLIKAEDLDKHLDYTKEMYSSAYYYNEDHLKYFNSNKSVKGITDTFTDNLWFDLDSAEDPEKAQDDAILLVDRLIDSGIKQKDIQIFFSGNKGFHVFVQTKRILTPKQVESICINKFGKGLRTLDLSVYDSNQIIRLPGTVHPKTKLHKIPIAYHELHETPFEDLKKKAVSLENITEDFNDYQPVELPDEYFVMPEEPKVIIKPKSVDISNRPPHWKDYKWALVQGMFEKGERHSAMMVIAASCRGLGYDEDTTRAICLTADAKHCVNTQDRPMEDLEDTVMYSVFSDDWNGGQYSYKNNPWLRKYCERMGYQVNLASDEDTIEITDAFSLFKDYAFNIDKNTIKTGIPALDKKLRLTIGMSVGLVAAPGVGKTSLALQMLNTMSKTNEQCVFFSYDMFHALVFQKLIQKHFLMQPEDIFQLFKEGNKEFEKEVLDVLKKEYANVEFCFKSGQTIDDMKRTIKATEEKSGKKVRFVVVDYNELVVTDVSDMTARSAQVAQALREIANSMNLCMMILVQPNKMAGSPSDELLSYRAIKGSSSFEQSTSVIIGLSRPGYDPRRHEEDKFVTINCLKNRMGNLFSVDLHWDGLTGTVREMDEKDTILLQTIRDRKAAEKDGEGDSWT